MWRYKDPLLPITWRCKDSHNKRLQVGSSKLRVQVGSIAVSQSISSWSRSLVIGERAIFQKATKSVL